MASRTSIDALAAAGLSASDGQTLPQQPTPSPIEQEPVAWRVRIGDSDSFGYTDNEEDADFIGSSSGLRYVKEPLYATPSEAVQGKEKQE